MTTLKNDTANAIDISAFEKLLTNPSAALSSYADGTSAIISRNAEVRLAFLAIDSQGNAATLLGMLSAKPNRASCDAVAKVAMAAAEGAGDIIADPQTTAQRQANVQSGMLGYLAIMRALHPAINTGGTETDAEKYSNCARLLAETNNKIAQRLGRIVSGTARNVKAPASWDEVPAIVRGLAEEAAKKAAEAKAKREAEGEAEKTEADGKAVVTAPSPLLGIKTFLQAALKVIDAQTTTLAAIVDESKMAKSKKAEAETARETIKTRLAAINEKLETIQPVAKIETN